MERLWRSPACRAFDRIHDARTSWDRSRRRRALEFLPDRIDVHCFGGTSSFDFAQVRNIEYEGIENRSRVKVLHAPFPKEVERILVITLDDSTELRVRVRYEHDAPLKEIAARQRRSPEVRNLSGLAP